jgi:hypothetical protein
MVKIFFRDLGTRGMKRGRRSTKKVTKNLTVYPAAAVYFAKAKGVQIIVLDMGELICENVQIVLYEKL